MTEGSHIDAYLARFRQLERDIPWEKVAAAIDVLFDAWRRERQIFVMGNGGSASTAPHLACDLAKYTIAGDARRFKVVSLTDNIPLVSAWTNDGGFGSVFVEQLRSWIQKDDVLIGISVHGGSMDGPAGPWSQNLVQAMTLARDRGARILGLSGFRGGALKQMADVCIVVPTEEEPLATPVIESWQVVIHHLICFALRRRIEANA